MSSNNMLRMSGMISGMDTESLVGALTSSYKTKVDKAKKSQTKLEWKQDAWKDMNKNIYSFYSGKLSSMRYQGTYKTKSTKVSNSALSVTAGANAVNGETSAKIISMAKAGILTGAKITDADGNKVTQDTKLTDLGGLVGESTAKIASGTVISITVGGKQTDITVTDDMTMYGFTSKLKEAGVNANFDVNNKRLFVSAKDTGTASDFEISCDTNPEVLDFLGITGGDSHKIAGSQAKLELNGVTFESDTNKFTINGSTYQINAESSEEIQISTSDDTSGVYNMIKEFLTQYNDAMKAMSEAYNAEATKYEPLTDEEKEVLSDKQIEDWEKKVKDAVLRKDSSLNDIMNSLKEAMFTSVEIDGEQYSLSSFGISTLGYFASDENERYTYHIDGDKDDEHTAGNTDKLAAAIAENPDKVAEFFSKLCQNVYGKLDAKMKSTEFSSAYKVYDDKKMKTEYDDYNKKIEELEKKLQEAEDRYYKKFSAMETMLSSINSKTDAISGLFTK